MVLVVSTTVVVVSILGSGFEAPVKETSAGRKEGAVSVPWEACPLVTEVVVKGSTAVLAPCPHPVAQ